MSITEDRDWVSLTREAFDWSDVALTQFKPLHVAKLRENVTSIRDLLERALAQAPGPEPPPDPGPALIHYQGFAVTYSGHDPARDCYVGSTPDEKEWGPHHGWDVQAPAPGRVEAYAFPTPLSNPFPSDIAQTDAYWARHRALFTNWTCIAPSKPAIGPGGGLLAAQQMYVAVYWPDTPLRLDTGQSCHVLWGGHCRGDIAVGRVATGDRIFTSWNSGINFEANGITARAAHVHLCGSSTGTLSPNGDIDALLIAEVLGWTIAFRSVDGPGPDQYMTGQWIAGRSRVTWAGHAIPPVPE